MGTKIYWTSIEYRYVEQPIGSKKLKGGFVYGFTKANDVQDALKNFIRELKLLNLSPLEIEFIKPYDKSSEWETPEDNKIYLSLVKEAKKTNNVIFDVFYEFEKK